MREAWAQRIRDHVRQLVRPTGVLATLILFILSGALANLAQTGTVWAAPVAYAAGQPQGKHTFQKMSDQGSRVIPLTKGKTETAAQAKSGASAPAPHGSTAVTMKPATVALNATAATNWTSSDGRLALTVPAGAVTPVMLTASGAAKGIASASAKAGASSGVSLKITETVGPSGGFGNGASGRISLGTYQFALVDAKGNALKMTLAKPVTLTYTINTPGAKQGWRGAGFDLSHVVFSEDSAATTAGTLVALGAAIPSGAQTVTRSYATTLNQKTGALTVNAPLPMAASGGGAGTWNTDSPQAHWDGTPDSGVDLSSGDLTYSYPLDVPAGPGGLTPKVSLSYDSSSVANEHNPQATAGWVGEGWNLSLGSISWGEHNVTSSCTLQFCPTVCTLQNFTSGCATFENSWSFSDPYGNGGDLIPQDSNLSIWYDDTINAAPAGANHIAFNIDNNPRIQVVAYTNPTVSPNFPTASYAFQPSCFRAFLPNGYMEEFGCTPDSLQYYVDANSVSGFYKGNYPYQWNLDMIVDPNGNQIHITYQQYKNFDRSNGQVAFPIDAVPATITYDSPSCHSTTTMCTGSAWQPAAQIVFDSGIGPSSATVSSSCPGGVATYQNTTTYQNSQTMRCDDVQDLSNDGNHDDAAPTLQSLATLNDVKVQVTTTPSAPSWQTLRQYNLSYEIGPGATITDPNNGLQESTAGYLDLTQVQEVGNDGAMALPPLTMTYRAETEYYVDGYYTAKAPTGKTNCGPSFNRTNCYLWAVVTGRYLWSLGNGMGWKETYSWNLAHNNTHGVNTGQTLEDPLACNTNESTSPCSIADDQNWSKIVLTQRQAIVKCVDSAGLACYDNNTNNQLTTTYSYLYWLTDVTNQECPTCTVDMYWGNENDSDVLDYYNTHFMGFHTAQVTNPDGSQTLDTFYSGDGYGKATASITCYTTQNGTNGCAVAPWTDAANALHGRVSEEDGYDTNGTTKLKTTTYTYALTCPPSGIGGSPHNATDNTNFFVGQRSSELDFNNPVVVCEIEPGTTVVSEYDGGSNHVDTTTTNTYTYNGYHMTQATQATTTTDNTLTPTILQRTQYEWDDALAVSNTSASGTYFAQLQAIQTTENGSGTVKACSYLTYDSGSAGATGAQTNITRGLVTRTDRYSSNCTVGTLSGQVSAASVYDVNGNLVATEDADALAGVSGHTNATNCTYSGVAYTACASYDALYSAAPATVTNALQQATTLNYTTDGANTSSPDATNGWGQWVTSATDPNQQVTSYQYDALGRLTATAAPGDTLSAPTSSDSYYINCTPNAALGPCYGLLTTQQLTSGVTNTSATYYDGWNRPVETVTPAFSSGSSYTYSVRYTMYDPSGRKVFVSDPYFKSSSSATPQFWTVDLTQPGTQTSYDGLGRVIQTVDAAGNTTTISYSVGQPTSGANQSDTSYYAVTTVVDANSHQTRTLVDGFGHTRYSETFTGNSPSTYALEGTTRTDYDWLGDVTATYEPNNYPTSAAGLSATAQTTANYNKLGQLTSETDADLGLVGYSYDQNGNVTRRSDPRGNYVGTVYTGYDGLNRLVWVNNHGSSSNAAVTYTYDQTDSLHGDGVGHLTHETFSNVDAPSGSPTMSGSYDYQYDARGRQIGLTQGTESNASAYNLSTFYNDANQVTTLEYSDNEVLGYTYNSDGWLTNVVTSQGGVNTNLFTNIQYSGVGGAAGKPTSASMANSAYTFTASYDNNLRLSSDSISNGSLTLYGQTLGYDGVSNVTSANTTLDVSGTDQTDNQAFCYNAQNQLVWAGSTGAPSCGSALTSGTLTSAAYQQSFSYDALGRLASVSTAGTYAYGDATHPHAATQITDSQSNQVWAAAYDVAGNLTCRAPNATTTCGGTPTGQTLAYDNAGQLTQWASAPSGSVSTAGFLYDAGGQRVEQQATPSSGSTTTTRYIFGGLEEDTGGAITKYYAAAGLPSAERIGTNAVTYLASDALGSATAALDGAGNVIAAQLFAPYGQTRYSSGTMPTAKGFTGQRADALSGLDYYGARYYDPMAGQFTSADTVASGLSPYGYVKGNPETLTDPSGHKAACFNNDCGGGGGATPPPSNLDPQPQPAPTPGTGATPEPPTPPSCTSYSCRIDQDFQNQKIRAALMYLSETSIGSDFLQYILYMAEHAMGDFITFANLGSDKLGATSAWNGYISLNSSISDEVALAAILVHEATESYFVIVDHQFTGTQHGDYVAEWFEGEFLLQYTSSGHSLSGLAKTLGEQSSIGLSFRTYMKNGNAGDALYGNEWQNSNWVLNTWIGANIGISWGNFNTSGVPNPMGLTINMLTASSL